jgi:hypothetical protein
MAYPRLEELRINCFVQDCVRVWLLFDVGLLFVPVGYLCGICWLTLVTHATYSPYPARAMYFTSPVPFTLFSARSIVSGSSSGEGCLKSVLDWKIMGALLMLYLCCTEARGRFPAELHVKLQIIQPSQAG